MAVARLLKRVLGDVVDFLVDDACQVCNGRGHRHSGDLDPVRAALTAAVRVGPVTNHPLCPGCAGRLVGATGTTVLGWRLPSGAVLLQPPARALVEGGGPATDAVCRPGAITLVSALRTNPTLLELVHRLKFSGVTSLAAPMGRALAAAAAAVLARLDSPVLVPVPMDAGSRRRRGFNQAEMIAAALGAELGVDVLGAAVVKAAKTSPQSLAGRNERLRNVMGAFRRGQPDVRGLDVVVVDDLVTTGATAAAVAATLPAASSVTVASVGRAL